MPEDGVRSPGVHVLSVPDRCPAYARRSLRGGPHRAVAESRPEADLRRSADDRRSTLRANSIVGGGTDLRLEIPEPEAATPIAQPEIEVTVVYEDDDLLIVDKPSGLVVHPAPGHDSGTLVNALLGRAGPEGFGGIAGVARPGHRPPTGP